MSHRSWKDGDIAYSGNLQKKGSKVKNWKTRWFELRTDGTLSYSKSKGSRAIGKIVLHPSHTSVQLVHQYNQVAQLGLTYKTFETVVQPELSSLLLGNNNNNDDDSSTDSSSSNEDEVKLDISKVFASYKRKYRSHMSDYMSMNNGLLNTNNNNNNSSNSGSSSMMDHQLFVISSNSPLLSDNNNNSNHNNNNNNNNTSTNSNGNPIVSPRRRDRRSMLFNNLEKFHPLKHITKSGMELSKYFKFTILNIDDSGETNESRKFNASSEVDRLKWISSIEKVLFYLAEKEKDRRSSLRLSIEKRKGLFSSLADYGAFSDVYCSNAQLLLNTVNSILKVEEDEVVAMIVLADKFVAPDDNSHSDGNGDGDEAVQYNQSLKLCSVAIIDELNNSIDQGTLFRRNSVSTRFVTVYFKIHGLSFLQTMLAQPLLKIVIEDVDYEIALDRITGTLQSERPHLSKEELETEAKQIQYTHFESLKQFVIRFLQGITSYSLNHCPYELRMVMGIMYEEGEKRWGCGAMCVGALFFLRFLCPAIISPHLFNICQMPPKRNAQRTLMLLTKIIQNISNGVTDTKKEPYMALFTDFIREMNQPLKDFQTELTRVVHHRQKTDTDDSKQFIDDSLTIQCLQLSHLLFQKSHTNNTFSSNEPEVVEFYGRVLDSLRISTSKTPLTSPRFVEETDVASPSSATMRARSRRNRVVIPLPTFHASRSQDSGVTAESSTTTPEAAPSTPSDSAKKAAPTSTLLDNSKNNNKNDLSQSTNRKRSFGWDLSDKEKASSQILASINACVGSVLLDTNTQLLNKSLHVMDMFDESSNSAFYLSTGGIQGAMRQLSSALYAFIRLNIKDSWSQVEDLVSTHAQLCHFMFEMTTIVQVNDDPLQLEEVRFHQLLSIALQNDSFLSTVTAILRLLDKTIDDRMKKRRKKIIDVVSIPNWTCYQTPPE